MKKIISALLSIMMIFSMATTSFASELPNEEPQFTWALQRFSRKSLQRQRGLT